MFADPEPDVFFNVDADPAIQNCDVTFLTLLKKLKITGTIYRKILAVIDTQQFQQLGFCSNFLFKKRKLQLPVGRYSVPVGFFSIHTILINFNPVIICSKMDLCGFLKPA